MSLENEPQIVKKVKLDQSALDQLKEYGTQIVADTGNFKEIKKYSPVDSTTNPSLILQAVNLPDYAGLIDSAIQQGISELSQIPQKTKRGRTSKKTEKKVAMDSENQIETATEEKKFIFSELQQEQKDALVKNICDIVSVKFGLEIGKMVEGYVSTEVDARLSFDKQASIEKAKRLIELYENNGMPRDRILIKLAATWEGIQAAKELKKSKINCNLTLLFSFAQAVACAEAGVKLISPFVGRILDYYQKANPQADYSDEKDPGVISVRNIYNYYKSQNYDTIVMGASFRNYKEILNLAGCDKLTIAPKLLEELQVMTGVSVQKKLGNDIQPQQQINLNESQFRYQHNQDPMANEKLSEGIRKFAEDIEKLENIILNKLTQI